MAAKKPPLDPVAIAQAQQAAEQAAVAEAFRKGITALRDDSTPYAPLSQRARNIVAGHRLKDILHHEYYVSDVPGLAIKSLERTWRDRDRASLEKNDTILTQSSTERCGSAAWPATIWALRDFVARTSGSPSPRSPLEHSAVYSQNVSPRGERATSAAPK